MHLKYKVTISENGRINIPTKIRDQLHLSSGDQLMLVLDKELKLIPLRNKIKEFQALVKSKNKNNISLVESLIESRKKSLIMNKCILDSSALLALFNSESGWEKVEELLPLSIMSTVNIAEVIAELDKKLAI